MVQARGWRLDLFLTSTTFLPHFSLISLRAFGQQRFGGACANRPAIHSTWRLAEAEDAAKVAREISRDSVEGQRCTGIIRTDERRNNYVQFKKR